MQVSVIPIGNSKGIRLSKTILEKYNISDSVELLLEKECIIIKPVLEPRKNWGKAFEKMHESGEDQALITDVFEDETFEEWT